MKIVLMVVFSFLLSINIAQEKRYIPVGADPQRPHRGIEEGEMIVKYHDDLYVRTYSASGSWSFGHLRRGEPLIVNIDDYRNNAIFSFLVLQCGNDTKAMERGVMRISNQRLEKDKIQIIVSYDDIKKQGGITPEQYDQLRSDNKFIVKEMEKIYGVVKSTNTIVKRIESRMDVIEKDIHNIEVTIEESGTSWLTYVLPPLITVAIGGIVYAIVENNSSSSTKTKEPDPSPGGPVGDPENSVFPYSNLIQVRIGF